MGNKRFENPIAETKKKLSSKEIYINDNVYYTIENGSILLGS